LRFSGKSCGFSKGVLYLEFLVLNLSQLLEAAARKVKPMLVAHLLASDFPSENPRTQIRNHTYK